jgi:Uma2 family endonuclease
MSVGPAAPVSPLTGLIAPVAATALETQIPLSLLRRFTVDEYHALLDAGVFAEDENYELLRGLLVHKMGKKRRHSLVTRRLRQFLEPMLKGVYVDSQEPVTTADSEPEPDVYVIRGCPEDYIDHQPLARDTLLVAEVAESTLVQDRGLKKSIYAEAGIPVYWIVNLVDRQIEVFTQPTGPAEQPTYAGCEVIRADGEVPVVIDGHEVGRLAVKDILA